LSIAAVKTRAFGAIFSTAAMPSGAATTQSTLISVAPRRCSRSMAYDIDPPVASIGSSTMTGRRLSFSGSASMYGTA
jgi:hypothetical protein